MSKQKEKMSPEEQAYRQAVAELPPCPQAVQSKTGCKVAWSWYATLEDAQIAAQYAYHRGVWMWNLGYDFGYQSPGSVEKDGDLFKVTWP